MTLAVIIEKAEDPLLSDDLGDDMLLEFRIDKDIALLEQLENSRRDDVILTLRSSREGGSFTGDRDKLLEKMIQLNPKYLDLEVETDLSHLSKVNKSVPILSKHNYSSSMVDLVTTFIKKFHDFHHREDIVIKIVGKPDDSYDMLAALDLARNYFRRYIVLGVGIHGIISRTLISDFHQEFVFGSTQGGLIPHYHELRRAHQKDSLLTGLIGSTLDHSLSPMIHRILRDQTNIPGYYHILEVHSEKDVPKFLNYLSKTSIKGINVTYPYKTQVVEYCQQSELVRRSGVANTLKFENNKIISHNTDISGFRRYFESLPETGIIRSALIVGAGGASRAVTLALLDLGIEVTIINRSQARLEQLPDEIKNKCKLIRFDNLMELEADLYINATTIGYGEMSPTSFVPFPSGCKMVIDLNYGKEMTILVMEARNKGLIAYDGKGMLYHQAVDAYEIWSGEQINREEGFNRYVSELDE